LLFLKKRNQALKKNFKEVTSITLTPLRPHLKWIVVGFALIISGGSIWYTNSLVEQIREREQRQMEIYARALEFLATTSENFLMVYDEIVSANHTIPVILADAQGTPEFHRNIPKADRLEEQERNAFLQMEMEKMKEEHDPIEVTLMDDKGNVYGTKYIYYKSSFLLTQLKYYPYIQLSVIALFGMVIFLVLNYLRRVEQDHVWVGLAKETAHQLGTPLSSLMAWAEYFKERYPDQQEVLTEFDKDVDRLKIITDRFSSIGGEPHFTSVNVVQASN